MIFWKNNRQCESSIGKPNTNLNNAICVLNRKLYVFLSCFLFEQSACILFVHLSVSPYVNCPYVCPQTLALPNGHIWYDRYTLRHAPSDCINIDHRVAVNLESFFFFKKHPCSLEYAAMVFNTNELFSVFPIIMSECLMGYLISLTSYWHRLWPFLTMFHTFFGTSIPERTVSKSLNILENGHFCLTSDVFIRKMSCWADFCLH